MNNRMEDEGSEQGYMEAKPESKVSSDSEPEHVQQMQQADESTQKEGP